MTCHVHEKLGEIYPDCTLDYPVSEHQIYQRVSDCTVAVKLHAEGKTRSDCPHWREPIEAKENHEIQKP